MAWDFGSLKNAMSNWLAIPIADDRRLPNAVKGDIINMRHREIARRANFRGMVDTESYTVATAGVYQYALPGDFASPSMVKVWDTSETTHNLLEGITTAEFDEWYPDLLDSAEWGNPSVWTIRGSYLEVAPPPSTVGDIIKLEYWTIPTDLTDTSPTSVVTNLCGDALLYFALSDACMYILEEQRAGMFLQRAQELLDQFMAQDARKIYEGRRPISEEP